MTTLIEPGYESLPHARPLFVSKLEKVTPRQETVVLDWLKELQIRRIKYFELKGDHVEK